MLQILEYCSLYTHLKSNIKVTFFWLSVLSAKVQLQITETSQAILGRKRWAQIQVVPPGARLLDQHPRLVYQEVLILKSWHQAWAPQETISAERGDEELRGPETWRPAELQQQREESHTAPARLHSDSIQDLRTGLWLVQPKSHPELWMQGRWQNGALSSPTSAWGVRTLGEAWLTKHRLAQSNVAILPT